jgi:hypothetical protein
MVFASVDRRPKWLLVKLDQVSSASAGRLQKPEQDLKRKSRDDIHRDDVGVDPHRKWEGVTLSGSGLLGLFPREKKAECAGP